MQLIVSFADKDQNHHGGIYQAGNWIYNGVSNENKQDGFIANGKFMHNRSATSKGKSNIEWVRKNIDQNATIHITKGKHRYLMPLTKSLKRQLEKQKCKYPKNKV